MLVSGVIIEKKNLDHQYTKMKNKVLLMIFI